MLHSYVLAIPQQFEVASCWKAGALGFQSLEDPSLPSGRGFIAWVQDILELRMLLN